MSEAYRTEIQGKRDQMDKAHLSSISQEYRQGEAEVERKYAAQFAELQKDGKCNYVLPFSYLNK